MNGTIIRVGGPFRRHSEILGAQICHQLHSNSVFKSQYSIPLDHSKRRSAESLQERELPNDHMSNAAMPAARFRITPARSATDWETALHLFEAYAESLSVDLTFQDFEAEKANLPGKYAPPSGELLLAWNTAGQPLGCIALKPTAIEHCCEMKRLYVLPQGRGLGLGKALVDAVVNEAKQKEYTRMRLDTLPTMVQAIFLYENVGFKEIDAYYYNPHPNVVFMELSLRPQ